MDKTLPRYYAEPGSVSTATQREEDLLERFGSALQRCCYHAMHQNCEVPDHVSEVNDESRVLSHFFGPNGVEYGAETWWQVIKKSKEFQEFINETLPDALEWFSPPGHYFGAHPGDSSDFGYWPSDESDNIDPIDLPDTE